MKLTKHNTVLIHLEESHVCFNNYIRKLPTLLFPVTELSLNFILVSPAGLKPRQWSEEVSIVFRNHVEKKPLVAQLEAVQEATNPWDRKLTVFLVDTSQEEKDIWVHDIMAEFAEELTNEL